MKGKREDSKVMELQQGKEKMTEIGRGGKKETRETIRGIQSRKKLKNERIESSRVRVNIR